MTSKAGAEGSFLCVSTRYTHVRPDGDLYPRVLTPSGLPVDPFIYAAHRAQRDGVVVDVQAHEPSDAWREAYYVVDVAPQRLDDERAYRDPQYALRVVHRLAMQADAYLRAGVIT